VTANFTRHVQLRYRSAVINRRLRSHQGRFRSHTRVSPATGLRAIARGFLAIYVHLESFTPIYLALRIARSFFTLRYIYIYIYIYIY